MRSTSPLPLVALCLFTSQSKGLPSKKQYFTRDFLFSETHPSHTGPYPNPNIWLFVCASITKTSQQLTHYPKANTLPGREFANLNTFWGGTSQKNHPVAGQSTTPSPARHTSFSVQSFVHLKGSRSLQHSRFDLPCTEIKFMTSSEIEMKWFLSDRLCP